MSWKIRHIFDGENHTISSLYVDESAETVMSAEP